MIIQHGDARRLANLPWAAVELTGESRIEEIVLHISRWMRQFEEPVQLLFPVQSRDLDGVKLLSPYLWIRSVSLEPLARINIVMGVQGLLRDHENRAIETEDEFVQEVIRKTARAADEWCRGIRVGTFVRILFGRERMLCGWVAEDHGAMVTVKIPLKTREVWWRGPARALLNLSGVPKTEQAYYYSGAR